MTLMSITNIMAIMVIAISFVEGVGSLRWTD